MGSGDSYDGNGSYFVVVSGSRGGVDGGCNDIVVGGNSGNSCSVVGSSINGSSDSNDIVMMVMGNG
ncbi:hypothetical protein PIROE2DRAFT_6799 [Piromyces sp. E2]|nr:hypothetical protein PIROE2DRAFT_6799 [Piromyces sp. E2]|eukprot:OUM66087.1 hypothetical protein PIROE2DRAFT_6799 [Piromyces sp. E2]